MATHGFRLPLLLVLSTVVGTLAQQTCWNCNWKRNSAGETIGGDPICIDGTSLPPNASYLVTDKPWEGSCVSCTKMEAYQEGELFEVQRSCLTEMNVIPEIGKPKTKCYDRKHYYGLYTFCLCDDNQLCNTGTKPTTLPLAAIFGTLLALCISR